MVKLCRLIIEDGAIAPPVIELRPYKSNVIIRQFVISDECMDSILEFLAPKKKKRQKR
jgi:hypothetical protein